MTGASVVTLFHTVRAEAIAVVAEPGAVSLRVMRPEFPAYTRMHPSAVGAFCDKLRASARMFLPPADDNWAVFFVVDSDPAVAVPADRVDALCRLLLEAAQFALNRSTGAAT